MIDPELLKIAAQRYPIRCKVQALTVSAHTFQVLDKPFSCHNGWIHVSSISSFGLLSIDAIYYDGNWADRIQNTFVLFQKANL